MLKKILLSIIFIISISVCSDIGEFSAVMYVPVVTEDVTAPVVSWNVIESTYLTQYPIEITVNEPVYMDLIVNQDLYRYIGIGLDFTPPSPGPFELHIVSDLAEMPILDLNFGYNYFSGNFIDEAGNQTTMSQVLMVEQIVVTSSVGTNDVVEIILPPGVATESIFVTINVVEASSGGLQDYDPSQNIDLPVNARSRGKLYDINFINNSGQIVEPSNLVDPLIITLPFEGVSTSQVRVKYLDDSQDPAVWRNDGIEIVAIDVLLGTITFKVDHLTMFGVFNYQDYQSPVIEWLKVNNVTIREAGVINEFPVIELKVSEQKSLDSGVVSWDIKIENSQRNIQQRYQSNVVNTKDARIIVDYTTKDQLPEGEYLLTAKIADDVGNVVSNSWILRVSSTLSVTNFLVGPNPVNINQSDIHFTYQLSKDVGATIKIFNVAGQKVKELRVDSGSIGGVVGKNHISWDGRTSSGKLPTGLYKVFLIIDDGIDKLVNKFLLLVTK